MFGSSPYCSSYLDSRTQPAWKTGCLFILHIAYNWERGKHTSRFKNRTVPLRNIDAQTLLHTEGLTYLPAIATKVVSLSNLLALRMILFVVSIDCIYLKNWLFYNYYRPSECVVANEVTATEVTVTDTSNAFPLIL